MDFLDPKKQKAHARRLTVGYVLIGLLLLLATTILFYQAYGFGIDRHGRLIQNGLVFVSSVPEGAQIYVNGERKSDNTNTRLMLPAGQYMFELKRDGYHDWQRAITVEGGTVQRFDYPFLFPTSLVTTTTKQYGGLPAFSSQSPDRRWLLVQTASNGFDLFDLDSDKPLPATFTLPSEILSAGTTTVRWEEVEWSKNNRHTVLRRVYDRVGQQSSEYILVDREDAAQSVNLSVVLGFTPTELQLRDKAHDQYYAFDQPNGALFTASLREPTPRPYLSGVLAFESDGRDSLVYATSEDAPPGKTLIRLRQGEDSYTVRQVSSEAAPYLLELGRFEGAQHLAVGASLEHKIYIYENPLDVLKKKTDNIPAPVHILKLDAPDNLSLSSQDRYIMAERDGVFATYDVKTANGYAYSLDMPVDALGNARWMDGHRLYVHSAGQVVVFDYDGTNRHPLVKVAGQHQPFFDRNYRKLYTLNDGFMLGSTDLRAEQDQ